MSRAPCRPGTTAVKLASDLEMGSPSSIACVTISCFKVLTTSTTGLAPDTVTACSIAPTCRSTLIVAVKFALSSMPSRRITENPGSVKVTV